MVVIRLNFTTLASRMIAVIIADVVVILTIIALRGGHHCYHDTASMVVTVIANAVLSAIILSLSFILAMSTIRPLS